MVGAANIREKAALRYVTVGADERDSLSGDLDVGVAGGQGGQACPAPQPCSRRQRGGIACRTWPPWKSEVGQGQRDSGDEVAKVIDVQDLGHQGAIPA